MKRHVCKAKVGDTLRDIHESGSWVDIENGMCLWYWDSTLRKYERKEPYTYPETATHMEMVGNRIQVCLPEVTWGPVGQVVVASGAKECMHWLARFAMLDSIGSPLLRFAIEQVRRVASKKILR